MENRALASALKYFTCQGNELAIGNVTLTSLAERYGTPLYVYSRDIIEEKHRLLHQNMPEQLKIFYAVKANPNEEIISLMGALYDGFDVASAGEARRVMDCGIDPGRISFAGPGKSVAELRYAIKRQIGSISIESVRELEHVINICTGLGKTANLLVRVNPEFSLSGAGMKMGGGPKQFGVDINLVGRLVKKIATEELLFFRGLHIFAGSQNLDADALLRVFEEILDYAVSLTVETGIDMEILNLGGGFGIPYFAHEKELDIARVGTGLKKLLARYRPKLKNTTFIIELGRYLVGECGVYLSRVLYRKLSKGQVFLVTDGGMHHHLAASGNFGQSLIRRPMPITVANHQGEASEKAHVVGRLCTPLDNFGCQELPIAKENDLIAVFQSGAYGFTASPHLFLSHPSPKEVLFNP